MIEVLTDARVQKPPKHTETLAEQRAQRSGESTEQKTHGSFFCTLLDIFTLIGPDIALLPPHSSQTRTLWEWIVQDRGGVSYFGGKKTEQNMVTRKKESEHWRSGGNVLWQQTNKWCYWSDPGTSCLLHWWGNSQCWKAWEIEEEKAEWDGA